MGEPKVTDWNSKELIPTDPITCYGVGDYVLVKEHSGTTTVFRVERIEGHWLYGTDMDGNLCEAAIPVIVGQAIEDGPME